MYLSSSPLKDIVKLNKRREEHEKIIRFFMMIVKETRNFQFKTQVTGGVHDRKLDAGKY